MRDSMIFYRSFFEAIKELPDENKLQVYESIFEFGLNFTEPEISGLSKTIFTLIKPQLEANIKRFENGKQPKKSKTEAKRKQNVSKTETNNNVNDNDNDNVNNNKNDNLNDNDEYLEFYDKFHNVQWLEKLAMDYSISANKIEELASDFEKDRKNDLSYQEKSLSEMRSWFVNYIKLNKNTAPKVETMEERAKRLIAMGKKQLNKY